MKTERKANVLSALFCLYKKGAGTGVPAPLENGLLLAVEISVERLDELVRVDTVHLAGLGDGFGGGVRAVQAVHAVGHEDGSDLRVELHDGSDGHISGNHGKTFFLEYGFHIMIHYFAHYGKKKYACHKMEEKTY